MLLEYVCVIAFHFGLVFFFAFAFVLVLGSM